jgi:hypothetical protein
LALEKLSSLPLPVSSIVLILDALRVANGHHGAFVQTCLGNAYGVQVVVVL